MTRVILKSIAAIVIFVYVSIMLPVIAFASEADLKIPSLQPRINLPYIGLCIISISITVFVIFRILKSEKNKHC